MMKGIGKEQYIRNLLEAHTELYLSRSTFGLILLIAIAYENLYATVAVKILRSSPLMRLWQADLLTNITCIQEELQCSKGLYSLASILDYPTT